LSVSKTTSIGGFTACQSIAGMLEIENNLFGLGRSGVDGYQTLYTTKTADSFLSAIHQS
jgi:hypothetical protein